MKIRTLLCLAVFTFGTFSLFAQKGKDDKVGGIRGGYQLSTMVHDGSKPDTAKNLSTWYIGLYHDQKIAKILLFGSGIEYFQNGLNYDNGSKRILHTISVPLDLKIKIGPVYALGGAAANIKVKEKIISGDNKYDPPSDDKSKGFDIAAFAGAGVKIFFISIEARYHWGLLEVRNDLYNRYLQLGAAISF